MVVSKGMFIGEKNPFYGKKHSEETKQKMRKNHADFNGDKNPFKKSLKDKGKLEEHKDRVQKQWDERDEEYRKRFGKSIQRGYEEISGTRWASIKSNAKAKNRDVLVTIEYCWNLFVKQNRRCAISGIKLIFSNKKNVTTASLDRIDSSKGYTEDNVQWLHKIVNLMKRSLSDKEFVDWCHKISDFKRGIG